MCWIYRLTDILFFLYYDPDIIAVVYIGNIYRQKDTVVPVCEKLVTAQYLTDQS